MSWKDAKQELFEAAAKDKQSIVLYFGAADDATLDEVDFAEYVDNGLVIALVATKPEAESEPKELASDKKARDKQTKRSRIPSSKLSSKNLWKSYGVTEAQTFVVTDHFGNEVCRTTSTKLAKYLVKVGKTVKKKRENVKKLAGEAKETHEEGDTKSALSKLHEAFSEALVGYEESDQAKELYSKIVDAGRSKLEKAKGDVKTLESLALTFHGSDLDAEIKEALTAAKTDD